MPPSSVPKTPWGSLYRSLLRESSYLPDPIANQYMRRYIRESFRDELPPKNQPPPAPESLPIRHRRGRQLLSILQRANQGYLKPLERVLFLSYGRIGKRRRELLEPLLYSKPTPEQPNLKPQRFSPDFDSDHFKPPGTVLKLVESQYKRNKTLNYQIRPILKKCPLTNQLQPSIPKTNAWGKPMPKKRKKNIRRKWYAKLLDSVYPFLPDCDQEVLHRLLTGSEPWCPPKRRKRVSSDPPEDPGPSLTEDFLYHGAPKGPTFELYRRGRPHKITRRLMAGLWRTTANFVPRMVWSERQKDWSIVWGVREPMRRISHVEICAEEGESLFAGLDSRGKVIHPPERE